MSAIRTLSILSLLALAPGCVVYSTPPRRRVVVVEETRAQPEPAPAPNYEDWPAPTESPGTTTVVESEPPPARYEVITESPGVDYVWVGGYWTWSGRWVWRPGYWNHGPRGYAWRSGVWVTRGGRAYWHGGGWVRHR